jgi:hypothetical protein
MLSHLFIYGSTALCWALTAFSVSCSFAQSVGLLGPGISPPQGRYLNIGKYKQKKHTQTSMLQVRFEPTIPVHERTKTVYDLGRVATVIGDVESWFVMFLHFDRNYKDAFRISAIDQEIC